MNILALDLSTKSTGWSISIDKKLTDYGCIQSFSSDVTKRIITVRDAIKDIIKKYNIDCIVLEEVRTDYKNAHTYKMLTWLQGAVVLAAYEINSKIDIEYLQPSAWRSKIGIHTGRGIKRDELKQADIQYVRDKYGIAANDDVCDSIGLLDAYLTINKSAW